MQPGDEVDEIRVLAGDGSRGGRRQVASHRVHVLGASAPAAWMAFVVPRIAVDTSRDPTSHNLWPFELLYSGALSVMAMAALFIARRLARTSH
jgi:hypothetical protein